MQTKNISGNSVLFSELKLAESRELQEILDSKILQDFLQGIDDEVLVVL